MILDDLNMGKHQAKRRALINDDIKVIGSYFRKPQKQKSVACNYRGPQILTTNNNSRRPHILKTSDNVTFTSTVGPAARSEV